MLCKICDGRYPESKHDFALCHSLDFAWDAAQMAPPRRRGLSMFACAGIAEHMIGETDIDIVLANELLPERCDLYKHEHPGVEMIVGDINQHFDAIAARAAELHVDFILATPPCQSFSTAGAARPDDERTMLFMAVIRMIQATGARHVMIENVRSFMNTVCGPDGKTISDRFAAALGADYHIDTTILDAQHFGVPQTRKRSITLMSRRGGARWVHPAPDGKAARTVRGAIGHLPPLESGAAAPPGAHMWHYAKKHNERHILWMSHTPTGKSAFENAVHFPQKKDGTRIRGFGNTYKRMEWDAPAPTITMTSGCISSQQNVHPGNRRPDGTYDNARALSVYEIMLLTGLRDDWAAGAGASDRLLRAVMGEAIPPRMAAKIMQTMPRAP